MTVRNDFKILGMIQSRFPKNEVDISPTMFPKGEHCED